MVNLSLSGVLHNAYCKTPNFDAVTFSFVATRQHSIRLRGGFLPGLLQLS